MKDEHTLTPEVKGTTGREGLSENPWEDSSSGRAGIKLSNSEFYRRIENIETTHFKLSPQYINKNLRANALHENSGGFTITARANVLLLIKIGEWG